MRDVVEAGADFVKDDEKLMSPSYPPLEERVKAVMPIILDHEQITGKKVMCAWGISHTDPDQMMRKHCSFVLAQIANTVKQHCN